eukprot:2263377-Pyramimonas_sp.AAC.1
MAAPSDAHASASGAAGPSAGPNESVWATSSLDPNMQQELKQLMDAQINSITAAVGSTVSSSQT